MLGVLENVLGVLEEVLGVLEDVLGVLEDGLGVREDVLGVLEEVLGVLEEVLRVLVITGTAETGDSLLRALKAVGVCDERVGVREKLGRGRGEAGLEGRVSVVKVETVGWSGTAGTALSMGDESEGTAGTGSRSKAENLGWSARDCLSTASSSLARSSLKLWTWGEGRGSRGSLARASLAPR